MPIQEVFSRMLDSIFARLGQDALYNNGDDPPFPVRVIARRPHDLLALGEGRLHAEDAFFEVRVSEVAMPVCGDEITVDNQRYSIEEQPRLDQHHLVWMLETLPV